MADLSVQQTVSPALGDPVGVAGGADAVVVPLGRADTSELESGLLNDYLGQQPEFMATMVKRSGLGLAAIALDASGLFFAMVLAAWLQAGDRITSSGAMGTFLTLIGQLAVCLPVFLVFLSGSRHRLGRQLSTTVAHQMRELTLPIGTTGLLCIGVWRAVSEAAGVVRPPEDALLLACVIGILSVAVLRKAIHGEPLTGGEGRRVLVVGSGVVADRMRDRLGAERGATVVGFVDDDPKDPTGCLGKLEDLGAVCEEYNVHHVVVAFTRAATEDLVDALRSVQGRLPISVVPRLFDVIPSTAAAHDLASGYPAISVAPATFGVLQRAVKRWLDLVGAIVGLVLAAPVLFVAAVGVRLSSPGPILLRHRRVGRNGQEFTVWKFRTFTVTESVPPPEVLAAGEQVTGPFPKLKNDPRATPFGRLLRRTSIDELPQLVNVLTGRMSLVGPRPVAPEFAWNFGAWALRRYAVKPGLTGLWQVSGRNDLTYEEMCRLDHLYVSSWSVGLDVTILARTARAVVGGQGCY